MPCRRAADTGLSGACVWGGVSVMSQNGEKGDGQYANTAAGFLDSSSWARWVMPG